MAKNPTPAVTLPAEFAAVERGNILLTNGHGDAWVGYVRIGEHKPDQRNVWLGVSIMPENSPVMNITTFHVTDAELAREIETTYDAWEVRKMNLDGVNVDDGYIHDPQGVNTSEGDPKAD